MKLIRKVYEMVRKQERSLDELKQEVEQKMMLALVANGEYEKWEYKKDAKTVINHILSCGKVRLFSSFDSCSPETLDGHIYIKKEWRGTFKINANSLQTAGYLKGDEHKFYRSLIKSLNRIPGVSEEYISNQNEGKALTAFNLVERYHSIKNPLQQ